MIPALIPALNSDIIIEINVIAGQWSFSSATHTVVIFYGEFFYVSASLDPEKTNLEFDLCIICQKREKESLVCKPSIDSYGKFLRFCQRMG